MSEIILKEMIDWLIEQEKDIYKDLIWATPDPPHKLIEMAKMFRTIRDYLEKQNENRI